MTDHDNLDPPVVIRREGLDGDDGIDTFALTDAGRARVAARRAELRAIRRQERIDNAIYFGAMALVTFTMLYLYWQIFIRPLTR